MIEHDFIVCVDARFPGGTSSAVVQELKWLSANYESSQVGILLLESTLFAKSSHINKALSGALRSCPFPVYRFDDAIHKFEQWDGDFPPRHTTGERIGRLHAQFLIIHNPYIARAAARLSGSLSALMALIVCHQPYVDNAEVPYYSAADIAAGIRNIASDSRFVPIGTASRHGFVRHGWKGHLAEFDWPNVFDFDHAQNVIPFPTTKARFVHSDLLTIGRHSRPDWVKWPDNREEFKLIYQYATRRVARFLGWGAYCDEMFREQLPRNWDTIRFNEVEPKEFLNSIDVFVYYHHSNWVEGFGRTIPEAIAAGLPCILSPALSPTFGGVALYASPERVGSLLDQLDSRRDELVQWVEFTRRTANDAFGLHRLADVYTNLSEVISSTGRGLDGFGNAEANIRGAQIAIHQNLADGFAMQRDLGLTDVSDRAGDIRASVNAGDHVEEPDELPTTDFAIYMDCRSARSTMWRSVELAQSLFQAGYAVSLVHINTSSKTDLATANPLICELSKEIRIYGLPEDNAPRHLNIRKGLIIAAPQMLFGETGWPLFSQFVRPITPAVVVLIDKKQPVGWHLAAAQSISLMCGVSPKWGFVGTSSVDCQDHMEVHDLPELLTFVADRSCIPRRDLLRSFVTQPIVRGGRIGLMDASQWAVNEAGSVFELFPGIPAFAFSTPTAQNAPREVLAQPDFHEFHAGDISLGRFLEKVDFVTYFPTESPSDAMLFPLLRAVQAGVLAIVDRGLEERLGKVAHFTAAGDLAKTVQQLAADPDHLTKLALANARILAMAGSQKQAVASIERLLGITKAVPVRPLVATSMGEAKIPPRPEVLFVSSNGVGLGHLTRLLAIARRLRHSDPVFATMSQAFRVIEACGLPVKYIPFHTVSGCDISQWNKWFRYELEKILALRASIRTVVFDGSNPYSGLMEAGAHSEIRKVWIQRGMWKSGQMNSEHVRRGKNFDLIIEPSDIAESFASEDVISSAFTKLKTAPIGLLNPNEILTREEARRDLGISSNETSCLIQLGSGTNRDIVLILNLIIPSLLSRGVTPYIAEWLMGSEVPRLWNDVNYLRVFPLSKFFNAFDFSISAAGYNSFHEIIKFGLPTIFVANDHQMMDDQSARAEYAMRNDAALWIAEEDVSEIGSAIDLILRREVRDLIVSNCEQLSPPNGAEEAARIIDHISSGSHGMPDHIVGGQQWSPQAA